MPVTAVRHLRKMRGGAQSHLIQADDGHWYVVKFRNNPQHRRILVNELISAALLDYLKISAPETAVVRITPDFLAAHPEAAMTMGSRIIVPEAGWHFGSRYPGDPLRTAVYDYLPDALLPKVANLADFRAVLVFDKWVANADGRQAVFYRARVHNGRTAEPSAAFVARMIDQGFAFNGPNWDFPESAVQGLYARMLVYGPVRSLEDFEPWLCMVENFPEEVMDRAWKSIPAEWIADEEEALERVLERLWERRRRVGALLEACREARSRPFPNWR